MSDAHDLIAVVGMACRFPGASDPERFWANLRDGVESIARLTEEELLAAGVPPALLADPAYVRAKGALDGVELFDAELFGFTPREAEIMDPQQRLFLECCWEACEHAGYDPKGYAGRIGVYGGAGFSSYLANCLMPNLERLDAARLQVRLFNDKDFLTTHVSYKLDLRGPSIAVQSACSTALVAAHLACQSLLDGESDMALAGGVTVSFPHRAGYRFQEGGIVSPDGHCRAFDARAQGTVEGNGAGVVLLKRLEDALADGDTVHAVIRASAVNNDGAGKTGYTAPSVESQARVVTEALALAGVEPDSIGYVEAHGSATPMGDPIEVEALTRAFRAAGDLPRRVFCALGSVKTNLGHADSAAGAASLIKTVQALKHRQIPPSLHFETPNPALSLDDSPFYVNTRLRDWPEGPEPRRAGVNSLGIGGTNVHMVLEEAPPAEPPAPSRPWQLLLLSARSETALDRATANLAAHLEAHPELPLADVAHTLRLGRRPFRHRRALVCRDREEALTGLSNPARLLTATAPEKPLPVSFLVPGIGDHYAGMGADLYAHEPVFRAALDRCAELFRPHLGLDIRTVLYPHPPHPKEPSRVEPGPGPGTTPRPDLRRLLARPDQDEDPANQRLQRTGLAHPVVFAVEYALIALWASWGIEPRALLGYSLGEYVAACAAGVFSLEDATRLVAARARLIDALPEGAMLAVPLPAADVEPLLAGDPHLALSAANGPALTVVGGPADAVDWLARRLADRGVVTRRMTTTHAFHTPAMEPIVPELLEALSSITLSPPAVPFVSNVTGDWITAAEATDPGYWARHLCRTVRFAEALDTLLAAAGDPPRPLLEVGPGQTLGTLARQHPRRPAGQVVIASLPDRREAVAGQSALLDALGRLWLAGAAPDWAAFNGGERRRRVPLPTYPFERRRYFVEPAAHGTSDTAAGQRLGLANPPSAGGRAPLDRWFWTPVWEQAVPVPPVSATVAAGERWLLLLDTPSGLAARLAEHLERAGGQVTRAVAGDAFTDLGDGLFAFDPGRRDDYDALLRALDARGELPHRIVHLGTLAVDSADGDALVERAFFDLLWLGQALGELAPERRGRVHLTAVSSGLWDMPGGDPLVPARALLYGPCRVLPQEMQGVTAGAVDLATGPEPDTDVLAARLARELLLPLEEAAEPIVALRGADRWVRRFRRVRLPLPEGTRLRQGGAWLIAGGLGETTVTLAEHLFRTGKARVALVLPPDAPARGKWAEWLSAHDESDEEARPVRRLLALEAAGCDLLVLNADLAQPGRAEAAVEQALRRFGALHGVVQAAGDTGAGLAQWKTRAMAEAVLAPRVRGTLRLAAAVRHLPLDTFLLFGSSAAATGGVGQVDTTAAAAFLDALARTAGPNARAIDWGFFLWQPVSAADPALAEQLRAGLAAYGIAAPELAAVVDRVLAGVLPQVVVSTQDLDAVLAQMDSLTAAKLAAGLAAGLTGKPGEAHPRPALAVPYVAPRTPTEEAIAEVWQQAFGIDRIGADDDFFDLAGSSLLAIQIVTRLTAVLEVELPMTSLLESPTVAELAARVEALRQPPAGADLDESEMERLLREIESLSVEEAEARLEGVGGV